MFDMQTDSEDKTTSFDATIDGGRVNVALMAGSDYRNTSNQLFPFSARSASTPISFLYTGGCGGVSAVGCAVRVTDGRYDGNNDAYKLKTVSPFQSLSGRTCGLGCGGRGGACGPSGSIIQSKAFS